MLQQSGVIYQHIDRPTHPDPIIVDAFSIPESLPVRVINEIVKIDRPITRAIEKNPKKKYLSTIKKHYASGLRVMVGMALIGVVLLLTPFLYAEMQFHLNPPVQKEDVNLSEVHIVESVVDTPTFTKLLNDKYVKKLAPVSTDYSIVIPKIGVNSAVVANVDPSNKKEYIEALKEGPAQAKGTAAPNEYGSKYIFAHSTDYFWNVTNYNAVFYLLKDLEVNDKIYIVYNNTLYPYKVSETRVVNADDTFYLKPNNRDNRLILQTCWPPGTTWKRMLVFAEPIDTSLNSEDLVSYSLDKSKTE